MANITLHTTGASGFTCISNSFIDNYMKEANGEFLKIYIYLLRWSGSDSFSISNLADRFDYTEKDVLRALSYWEKMGFLRLEYDSAQQLTGIYLLDQSSLSSSDSNSFSPAKDTAASPAVSTASEDVSPEPTVITLASKPSYTPEELDAFKGDEGVEDLFYVIQIYMGKPLSHSEANTLLFWYDSLHLPIDLIEYLVESCIDKGHPSLHYMDTIARSWAEAGITTVADAKAADKFHSVNVFSIMKSFGIKNRSLIDSEMAYIKKWTEEYQLSLDIICEACKRTILQTNKPSFKYADSILTSWRDQQVKSLQDIEALDQAHAAESAKKAQAAIAATKAVSKASSGRSSDNFSQRSYDYDELEKLLLSNS